MKHLLFPLCLISSTASAAPIIDSAAGIPWGATEEQIEKAIASMGGKRVEGEAHVLQFDGGKIGKLPVFQWDAELDERSSDSKVCLKSLHIYFEFSDRKNTLAALRKSLVDQLGPARSAVDGKLLVWLLKAPDGKTVSVALAPEASDIELSYTYDDESSYNFDEK